MRIYASATQIKLDKGRLNKDIRKLIDEIFYDAMEEFVKKTAPNIPILTGMARGSLLNLRAFLESKGRTLNDVFIPERTLVKGIRYYHTDSAVGEPQGPPLSPQYTTPSQSIYKWKGNVVSFTYESRIRHLNINDMNPPPGATGPVDDPRKRMRSKKRPWLSFDKGRQAFLYSLQNTQKKITRLQSYLLTTSITGGKQSGFSQEFRLRTRNVIR